MKIEELKKVLNESGADNWKIIETVKHGWEFYYIKHELDQNRVTDVKTIEIIVYKNYDNDQYTGLAAATINPSETDEYIKKTVADLVAQSEYVKDRYFDLKESKKANETISKELAPLADISKEFIRTMDSVNETETEDINSYEIFTSHITKRIITSKGIDVTQTYPSSMLEAVVNARTKEKDHEIELYRAFNLGTCDEKNIKDTLDKAMKYGKDRLCTTKTPALAQIPCLFTTSDSKEIYRYFISNLNTGNIYRKTSKWQKGTPISKDIKGDKVTVKAVKYLENSSTNFDYDVEGTPVRDMTLMKEDVPVSFWGSTKFGYYLDEKDTFMITNSEFSGGTKTEEEIRKGKYLEIVEFSDFQVHPMTGDIFGEIRLAYLHEDVDGTDKVTAVSGGSVSGNMSDFIKNMSMTKEQVQYDNYKLPKITRLENVTVSGAGE